MTPMGEAGALSVQGGAVGVVARERVPWRNGWVDARVCCSEEDLTPVAPLQACACNAGGIVSPSNVVDQVGIRGVADRFTCVDGAFGAESGVKDGGMSLNGTEVEGMGTVGSIQGGDEIPTELLLVVEAECSENCVIVVSTAMGD